MDTQLEQMTACLDLLLRWAVLRFCDEKLQSVLKVQAFLSQLLIALADAQYQATDNEAGMLLPCLCDKVGHNQDRCRSGYKELLAQFRVITNPHRMAVYVMEVSAEASRLPCLNCLALDSFLLSTVSAVWGTIACLPGEVLPW